jgi:tRNA A37 threonylcarbamoyladenosine dehydratase
LSHFQNSVSFENGFGKIGQEPDFSIKSKDAFSKTEVLKRPRMIGSAVTVTATAGMILASLVIRDVCARFAPLGGGRHE